MTAGALALSLTTAAVAQQPLTTPHYYSFQLPTLTPGTEALGTLEASDGQNFKDGSRLDLFTLNAAAGVTYGLAAASFDFGPVVSVFDPIGNLVAFSDFADEFGEVATTFTADSEGRHVVVLSGWSEFDLGAYTIALFAQKPASEAATAVTLPLQVESVITEGLAPAPDGYAGGAELYSFSVEEELLFLASMSSFEVDAVLTLYDEQGNLVAANDDNGFSTDSLLAAKLQPGSYLLAAGTYHAGEVGTYSLTLETYYRR